MSETICNACLIESSLRGDQATHCVHAMAELERQKEKIAEQERLHKQAQQAAKQNERRELFKQVALAALPLQAPALAGDTEFAIRVAKATEVILKAADEFSKKLTDGKNVNEDSHE